MTQTPARPRDVVFAGVLTIMGSVLALAGIFGAQGELRSSAARREIEAVLADDRFSAIDISVDTVLNLVEVGLMAASAASVAAIVFAVFSMRGHNPSRIALTLLGGVAAGAVLLSGLAGLAIAVFVVYTVSLLWRAPVRSWFAHASADGSGDRPGREPGDRPEEQPGPSQQQPDPYQQQPDPYQPQHPGPYHPQPGQQPGPFTPPPEQGHPDPAGYPPGYQPGYPQAQPQSYGYGYGYPPAQPYGYGYPPSPVDPDRRPAQTVAAHVMTWVGTAFGLFTGLFFVLASGSDEIIDLVMEQLAATEISQDQFVQMLRLAGAVTVLWSLAVAVVSVFSWRRANWAAIVLTVMGGGYLLVQIVTLVTGQLAVLFTIVWVAAVLVLLWWPTSRQWYAGGKRSGQRGPYGPAGGPSYPPPAQRRKRNQPW